MGPPWPHPACLPEAELLKACTLGRGRAGGPGGQNRNKVETLVMIRHDPTGLESHAGERRSQGENRAVAIRRLRLLLATHIRVDPSAVTSPRTLDAILGPGGSALWKSRARGGRIACNPDHDDYPSLLAEALDVLSRVQWDATKAARQLDVSATQLLGLIRDHPPAFAAMNGARRAQGLHGLR